MASDLLGGLLGGTTGLLLHPQPVHPSVAPAGHCHSTRKAGFQPGCWLLGPGQVSCLPVKARGESQPPEGWGPRTCV